MNLHKIHASLHEPLKFRKKKLFQRTLKKILISRAPLKIACDAHQDFKSFKNLDDKRFPKSFRESLKG